MADEAKVSKLRLRQRRGLTRAAAPGLTQDRRPPPGTAQVW